MPERPGQHHNARQAVLTTATIAAPGRLPGLARRPPIAERFERHRQPWTQDEIQKLHLLAKKGMALKAIAKAMTRSEESIKDRAKLDGLAIARLR